MDEDRELERRLDAMYGSARPRASFEEELWSRIQARRPWRRRLGDWLQPGLRLAPALAAFLVLAVGLGFLATRIHPGGGGAPTLSSQTATGGASRASGPGFGVVPSLPGAAKSANAAPTAAGPAGQTIDQSGPRSYRFVGRLPVLPDTLPVYRYDEPTPAARSAAAARLEKQTGLRVEVQPSRPAGGQEPQFVVRGVEAQLSLPSLVAIADAFVTGHRLTPGYPFQVIVPPSGQSVIYARQFPVPGASAPVARPAGGSVGLAVQVQGNLVVGAGGPLELPLDTADYPLRPAAEALAAAGAQPGAGGDSQAVLDKVQLVYVVVVSGGHGYYEPELLFSGSAGSLLGPLISPNWLSR